MICNSPPFGILGYTVCKQCQRDDDHYDGDHQDDAAGKNQSQNQEGNSQHQQQGRNDFGQSPGYPEGKADGLEE